MNNLLQGLTEDPSQPKAAPSFLARGKRSYFENFGYQQVGTNSGIRLQSIPKVPAHMNHNSQRSPSWIAM